MKPNAAVRIRRCPPRLQAANSPNGKIFFPIEKFKKELSAYKTSKWAVQFPLDKPLPLALIRKIVKFRAAENLKKAEEKFRKKK